MRETNFSKAKKWLKSALADIKRVLKDLERDDFADIAFRSQFAVEKINKSILNFFGIKIEKVHDPSTILDDFLKKNENLQIDSKTEEFITNLIKYSKVFEKEGTKTRYGTVEEGELITAEEIYSSFGDVIDLIIHLNLVITHLINFLKYFSKKISRNDFLNIKEEFEDLNEALKKWI